MANDQATQTISPADFNNLQAAPQDQSSASPDTSAQSQPIGAVNAAQFKSLPDAQTGDGSSISAAPSTTQQVVQSAKNVAGAAVNGNFPYIHPIDAMKQTGQEVVNDSSWTNMTHDEATRHPVEAAVGQIANNLQGFLFGNETHAESNPGSNSQEGLANNPVTLSILPVVGEENSAASAVGKTASKAKAFVSPTDIPLSGEEGFMDSELSQATKGPSPAAQMVNKAVQQTKEVARQMLVYGEGKAEKIAQIQSEFKDAYPALTKLMPIVGKTAGVAGGTGAGVLGVWEFYKYIKGF
jgi:hypothetical protein